MPTRRWSLLLPIYFAMLAWGGLNSREISGVVTDKRGNLLPGAVVQIDNSVTKEIQSFIVQQDGRYHFRELNPDIDFTLHAQYRGHLSKTSTLSKLDGAKVARLDFVIPID
jgi:hypothetical protein